MNLSHSFVQAHVVRDETISYRADIDGWRAVAVIAVIAHHFDKAWLPSGYLGVDVFFVISGYVITLSLLNRKAESFGAFLTDFYARRMRRLMPALATCVLGSSIAIWFADPASRQSLSTGLGALFGVSNILLANQDVDYFSPSTELNAFTHTWSLGVEEQFYLIFPLLLWGVAKVGRARDGASMRRFIAVLSAAMVLSGVVFVTTAQSHPVFNYYHLPARFWELAAGALTFLAARRLSLERLRLAPLVAAAILGGAFFLPIEQRVLGTFLAVAATAALLATTPSSPILNSTLTWPALRFLGRISYPLYLWHWPVLAVSRFTIGVSIATLPFQLALMLGLAWATYRFIETPVRRGQLFPTNRRVLVAGLCVALASAAVPVTLRLNEQIGPFKSAATDVVPPDFLPLPVSGAKFVDVCLIDAVKHLRKPDTVERCTAPPLSPGGNTIWAFGDSHAGHLQAMLYGVRDITGMGVHLISMPNTPYPSVVNSVASPEGQKTFDLVSPHFKPGDIVVLARFYLERGGPQRIQPDVAAWIPKAAELARQLEPRGVRLVVVGPPPVFRYSTVLSCARNMTMSACVPSRSSMSGVVDDVTRQLEAAAQGNPNMILLHPFPLFCPPSDAICTPFLDGQLAFRDQDHLNVVGSASLIAPFMERLRLAPATDRREH